MKKLILKTALLTLGITIILGIAVFGIVSFVAPAAMVDFSVSLGLDGLAGDYAYQEYERSGSLTYLARSFEISASRRNDRKASERFDILYGEDESERREEFYTFCNEYVQPDVAGAPADYRMYLCGQAARVKYRLAGKAEEKSDVLQFALSETDVMFSHGNPLISLAVEAASAEDKEFCGEMVARMEAHFSDEVKNDKGNDYRFIINILKEKCSE